MTTEGRFIMVEEKSPSTLRIRVADSLRVNLTPDDPAQTDDYKFAMAILECIACLPDAEEITLNVLDKPITTKYLEEV